MLQRLLTYFIIPFISIAAFVEFASNDDLTDKIINRLDNYILNKPQEKVFLHFDKSYYMAGETMWFKGYIFNGNNHNIDSVSAVLYIDLIDTQSGKIINSKKVKCAGTTYGELILPDSLMEGMYIIRAYTNYMRNYSDEFFFHQDFKIWQGNNKNRIQNTNYNKLTEVADLQFFPEGGNLVADLESRVGFKALNNAGKGIDVEGFILENDKDTVLVFKSENLGMGKFNFTPNLRKKYSAHIKQSDGNMKTFAFPLTEEKGYAIAVDNLSSKDKIKIFVTNNAPVSTANSSDLMVVAHQRGSLCFMAKSNNSKKTFSFAIPKNLMKDDGIVQITLMNAAGEPICERLVFNNSNKNIRLKLSTDKASYTIREKVKVSLEATDEQGKPVQGNFSVAVTDAGQVIEHNKYQENILTYLLLSSDVNDLQRSNAQLRGHIENPYHYFDSQNSNAAYHLDILMLTQGWRRFDWKTLLVDQQEKIKYFVETGLEITGKATRLNGKLANNLTMTMLLKNKDKDPIFKMTETDSLGNFGFFGLQYFDSTSVLVQASKQNGSKQLTVNIDPESTAPKVSGIPTNVYIMAYDDKDYQNFLATTKESLEFEKKLKLNSIQNLDELIVKAKRTVEPDSRKIYGAGAGTAFKVDNNICMGARDVLQMLQGRVPGIQIIPDGINGSKVSIRGAGEPLFLIDGIQITLDAVNAFNPCDVEQIDILKGPEAAIYGVRGGNGVINVLTKRGNDNYDYANDIAKGISVVKRLGYNTPKEFYAPKYDIEAAEHLFPDFRSTLQWLPNISTDAAGKAEFTYWNTDAKTNIKVNAQGTNLSGSVGVGSLEYTVK